MLPQYDDPVVNEGVTLDERGRFGGEAEKKLQEVIFAYFCCAILNCQYVSRKKYSF
ncbi:hypothetical protein Hanom_Chr09g00777691 [Helianthus anomalus]